MIHDYNEFILTEKLLLNGDFLITEKLSFDKIKNIVKSVKNKDSFIKELLSRFNSAKNKLTKKNIAMILVALFLVNFATNNSKWSNKRGDGNEEINIEDISNNLAIEDTISMEDISNYIYYHEKSKNDDLDNQISIKSNDIQYVDPQTLSLSEEGKKFIIKEEGGYQKTAYQVGGNNPKKNDGMITIGYGHAEPIKTSKYKVGDIITIDEADKLLDKDLKYFEGSIKRMFKQWDDKGHKIKITQGMYDALVSMAYNMGVTRLRNTKFIDFLMAGEYDNASEIIPKTKLNKKFPGIEKRRKGEQELFIKNT